jgi:hypothetical protein
MRQSIITLLAGILLMSCQSKSLDLDRDIDYEYGRNITHGMIELGDRLENPYKTENIREAFASLYPTKSREEVKTTNYYVRFLPQSEEEFNELLAEGLILVDHPLDFEIVKEGDWYHDPEIPDDDYTWQYAVVPTDFDFKDYNYEMIDECFISENRAGTRSDGVDWDAVEAKAFTLTGNADKLGMITRSDESQGPVRPEGRITIVDEDAFGGKPVGVSGVMVLCNSFVKFSKAYTDKDGFYKHDVEFSSKVRYSLVFKNKMGFSIGFNFIIVPASVSTLGKASPQGINMTITRESEEKLFNRCAVNNSAYDYYERCSDEDMNVAAPPSDLRIWIFHNMVPSCAPMIHHGALISAGVLKSFIGKAEFIVALFAPDITIGLKGRDDYSSIYDSVVHELAHASHFSKVGKSYWNTYINYVMESYIKSGKMYGDGTGDDADVCEIGEMWAFHLNNKLHNERYGGSWPSFGSTYWFYPQIFRYMEERGVKTSEIFNAMGEDIKTKAQLKERLKQNCPSKSSVIDQAFNRYTY